MMLKITRPEDADGVFVLRLEGRLTQQTVGELKAACEEGLGQGQAVLLELGGVAWADLAGAAVLRDLEHRGCVLVGASPFVSELLRHPVASGTEPAPEPPDGGEAELLEGLRRGDPAAFETLVRRQGGPLLAAVRRILGNDDDARDALQDAFVSAFRGIAGFGGGSRVSTWLHRIAINAALMKLRSRRRRNEEPIDDLLPTFDETGHWASGMARTDTRADVQLQSRQTREMVRRCIERLPESHRTVLVLRDIEDLDTGEVADALGITANAVKIRLHRARQALRTLIERERAAEAERGAAAARGAGAGPMAAARAGRGSDARGRSGESGLPAPGSRPAL